MNTIYKLNINTIGKISHLSSLNSVTRLSEMWIIPGAEFRIIKKNPFDGPIQIKLNDSYLILRKEDANKIFVK